MRSLASRSIALTLAVLPLACGDSSGGVETGETGDTGTETAGEDEIGTTTDDESGESSADESSTEETSVDAGEESSTEETSADVGDEDTTDSETDTGEDTGEEDEVLTFIAMGDAGEGNEEQYLVADIVEQVCADKGGCAFVLYLGDNFYDDGVESVDDDQFQAKFELPYADLDMPFHIVLGNHDYGELSFLWEKSAYEIEYSDYSDKWSLPSEWYGFTGAHTDFFVFDTTRFMWNHDTSEQQNWIDDAIGGSTATWKIAAGHHPYYSNGAHGNAGSYEGVPSWIEQVSGTVVKEVMDDSMCGKVDLYLSGHDHNRQWVTPTCAGGGGDRTTHFIVSGAGCKTTDFEYHDGGNDVYWEDDTTPGFTLLQVSADTIHTEIYDLEGNLNYERDITK
ncbi:metallophosphoesterase [Pseudenhygromyxa sp. WMMC2535]|uniref:metallophosphoesterase n=1 Tax=Pseudenhygromyxa sp. WMMC2535 TaxID=2712867 RepID=UPI001556E438|nr:metallophosphoesterase [Pseudenhygromyxa sp. WMMC2535]NVB41102.1 metallophosphoesterase [Pseudenhygromyxa sp. WMMC2535]